MKAWWILVMVAAPAILVAACGEDSDCPGAAQTVTAGDWRFRWCEREYLRCW